jgi:peptidoglycan hydrolase-like protein with peptidoglycan-binding domain
MNNRLDLENFDLQPFSFEEDEEFRGARGGRIASRRPSARKSVATSKASVRRKSPGKRRPRPGTKFPVRRPIRPVLLPVWPDTSQEPAKVPDDQKPARDATPTGTGASPPPPESDQVSEGSEFVRWVQVSLNQILNLNLRTDGVMDTETRNAIRRFQQREGLPVTGAIGPDTQRALIATKRGSANGKAVAASREILDEFSLSQFPQSVLSVLKQGLVLPAVKLAIAFGYRNENQLTDLLFNARHPERSGRAITKGEPGYQKLVSEWISILDSIIRPALRSAAPASRVPSATKPSTAAPKGTPDIVKVRGIKVARQIAKQIDALLAAAAADGVKLSGGGYRSHDQQIKLRIEHCGSSHYDIYEKPSSQCTPPTARPGRSNHEKGLAIDFTYNGKTIKSRTNPGFKWLAANAVRFGLYNLPSEPWHWSVDGR